MKTVYDAWNSRDWDTFSKLHAYDVVVRLPGQPPTNTIDAHKQGAEYFCKTFPDNRVQNNPYKVLIGQGDWTCSIAVLTGTHQGPMMGPGEKAIPPTNKTFKLDFCTIVQWKNGRIAEENLFYDQMGMMTQLGLMM